MRKVSQLMIAGLLASCSNDFFSVVLLAAEADSKEQSAQESKSDLRPLLWIHPLYFHYQKILQK